jgi:hypothetical protein
VTIEAQLGSSWMRIATIGASDTRVFDAPATVAAGTVLRARQAGETSLSWRVGATYG